jgi:hypothetical protein
MKGEGKMHGGGNVKERKRRGHSGRGGEGKRGREGGK